MIENAIEGCLIVCLVMTFKIVRYGECECE